LWSIYTWIGGRVPRSTNSCNRYFLLKPAKSQLADSLWRIHHPAVPRKPFVRDESLRLLDRFAVTNDCTSYPLINFSDMLNDEIDEVRLLTLDALTAISKTHHFVLNQEQTQIVLSVLHDPHQHIRAQAHNLLWLVCQKCTSIPLSIWVVLSTSRVLRRFIWYSTPYTST
jgi:hypothetical protein